MKPLGVKYAWETYPEYSTLQQFSRCVGRVLASLPRRLQRKATRKLVRASAGIATGFAGAHAEVPPAELSRADRELFLEQCHDAVALSRDILEAYAAQKVGDRASITAALELLERFEAGLNARPLP